MLTADQLVDHWTHHRAGLTAWVRVRVWDPDIAADIVSEAYTRAWARRAQWTPHEDLEDSVAAWINAIARNLVADHRKAASTRRVDTAGLIPADIADPAADRAYAAVDARVTCPLGDVLDVCTDEQRQAIQLHVIEGRGHNEIADRLGIEVGASKARVFRGMSTIRREWTNRLTA